jgi:hypothetical protein
MEAAILLLSSRTLHKWSLLSKSKPLPRKKHAAWSKTKQILELLHKPLHSRERKLLSATNIQNKYSLNCEPHANTCLRQRATILPTSPYHHHSQANRD